MQKIIARYTLVCASFLTLLLFVSYSTDEKNTEANHYTQDKSPNSLPQIIQAIDYLEKADFAGEALPLDDFDVKERLDRELLVNAYWQSNTLLNIKKANKYFPTIERILAEENMPDDLKYLAVAESSLRNVTSPAGAKGFWQFMKGTGKQYGLEINSEVDERFHLEKSTRAACQYLRFLKNKLGSWTLAAAAYNMGESGLNKNLTLQGENSYYDINTNVETGRYIFRIVAIKEILKNPRKYGFYVDDHLKYAPLPKTYQVVVNTSTDWATFAEQKGISYRTLKVYNPWLTDTKLTVKSKTYYIDLPKK